MQLNKHKTVFHPTCEFLHKPAARVCRRFKELSLLGIVLSENAANAYTWVQTKETG